MPTRLAIAIVPATVVAPSRFSASEKSYVASGELGRVTITFGELGQLRFGEPDDDATFEHANRRGNCATGAHRRLALRGDF